MENISSATLQGRVPLLLRVLDRQICKWTAWINSLVHFAFSPPN